MKIAVYHNLPSGGGKRALFEMIARLYEHHEMDVYTLSCAEHEFGDLRPFVKKYIVYPFKTTSLLGSPFGRINQGIRVLDLNRLKSVQTLIAKTIDQEKYDLVFVHNCQFEQSPEILCSLKTPSVYYSGEPPRFLYEPKIKRPYYRESTMRSSMDRVDPLIYLYRRTLQKKDYASARAATILLANSAFSRENFYRIYNINARVCYLGVDTNIFHPLNLPKMDFVLSVGALHPGKGYDFLIQSIGLIPLEKRPSLIIIANSVIPDEQLFLENLATEYNVSLKIRTRVQNDELIRCYNEAKLTVYTPVMEPFGFVPIESMACETSVVGVSEGGVRESIQHQKTGMLCDRDPYEFAETTRQLLDSPEVCSSLGQAGRSYVLNEWQWEKTIQKLEYYFLDVVHK